MKNGLLILLLFLTCCTPVRKVKSTYQSGTDFLSFDWSNNRFYYVERKPASFYNYAEGFLSMNQDNIYLHPYPFDSCMSYKMEHKSGIDSLRFFCSNYDPRVNIFYEINGNSYKGAKDGSLSVSYSKINFPAEVKIKVLFPDNYNYSCYKKHSQLNLTLTVSDNNVGERDNIVLFNVNYNFFNWFAKSDTLKVEKANRLRSMRTNYSYRIIKDSSYGGTRNYLSDCLMPYLKK